jgi:class 3 adenylate cyclase
MLAMSNLVGSDRIWHEPTILCSSIRNFAILKEKMTPDDYVRFSRTYLSRMETAIVENGGSLEGQLSETFLALFEAGADRALKAGIAMLQQLAEYNQTRQSHSRLPLQIGIGIDTPTPGEPSQQLNNGRKVATWLEELTQLYGASLLISHRTFLHLENPIEFALRSIDRVEVVGQTESVSVFEVFECDPPRLRNGKLSTKQRFEQAILLYYLGEFDEAIDLLSDCLRRNQGDKLITIYLQRAQTAQVEARLK